MRLHWGPYHVLMNSVNFGREVKSLISSSRKFQILGPSILRLFSANFVVFTLLMHIWKSPCIFMFLTKYSTLSEKVTIVFSSVKFWSCASFMKWNRLFIKMLKSNGPRIHLYGIPGSRIWNILRTLVAFMDYFRRFRYEYKKVRKSSLILAISKSWGMQSKAFGKSMKTASTILVLSTFFLQFTIRLISTFSIRLIRTEVFSASWNKVWQKGLYYREHTIIYESLLDFENPFKMLTGW